MLIRSINRALLARYLPSVSRPRWPMGLTGDELLLFMVGSMCSGDKRDAAIMLERTRRPREGLEITPQGVRVVASDRRATHSFWMRAAQIYLSHGKARSARAAVLEARRVQKACA